MEDLQTTIQSYLEERNWAGGLPGDYAKSISIEAGELLEHFQWKNYSAEEVKNNPELLKEISAEVADVIIYSIELCISLGLDYQKAVTTKLEIVKKKYPAKRVKDHSENYYAIHKQYRSQQ